MGDASDIMRFTAAAAPESLAVLRARLSAFLDAAGATDDLRFEVTLAVSEAANNVLQHAYRHRASPGEIVVVGSSRDGQLRIVVSDEGGGLAPRPDSPGAGLGLPVMARLCHDISIVNREQGGTEVTMIWSTAG